MFLACGLVFCPTTLESDEIGDLFQTPTTEAEVPPAQTPEANPQATSPLSQYQATMQKVSISWDLSAGGGAYLGWKSLSGLSDPINNLAHSSLGTVSLTSTLDVRPFDYFRMHESSSINYPGGNYAFNISWLNELFFDYAFPSGLYFRLGKYAVSWGDARILSVANLPGRSVNVANLDPSVEILPSWLQSPTPSLWLKGAIPFGNYTATGLMSLPGAANQGLSSLAYGLLNEYVIGKTYLGIAGFYQNGKTARASFMVKTSKWNTDFYLDSSLAFPLGAAIIPSAVLGLYYKANEGPEIKITAELCWNGESTALGGVFGDALPLGGLSQALALSWTSIGGSRLGLGYTWYHAYIDGSGTMVLYASYSLGHEMSLKSLFPFVYGPADGYYVKNRPSETFGYALGAAPMLILSLSF
jgi:hypothetical protein